MLKPGNDLPGFSSVRTCALVHSSPLSIWVVIWQPHLSYFNYSFINNFYVSKHNVFNMYWILFPAFHRLWILSSVCYSLNVFVFSSAVENAYKIYGHERWSLTLKEESRLKVFEQKVLSRIFWLRIEAAAGDRKTLQNEELHNLYSSPSIIRILMSRRMRWAGIVVWVGMKGNAYRLLLAVSHVKGLKIYFILPYIIKHIHYSYGFIAVHSFNLLNILQCQFILNV
jgi:hypothetical protein